MALRKRIRDARSGRFGRKSDAEAHPETTVTETISDMPAVLGKLRWRISNLEPELAAAAQTMTLAVQHFRNGELDAAYSMLLAGAARANAAQQARIPEELA